VSSKPSKWLFDIKGGRHERNWKEFSVAGFIFTYVHKYFSGPLSGGRAIAFIAPPPVDPLLLTEAVSYAAIEDDCELS